MAQEPAKIPAVAYYRHSAQDRQENSIPIQRDQVREWAEKNGIEIVEEFADHGKSGLNAEGRPAFNEMMDDWVEKRKDFQYVLCLDVSRSYVEIDSPGCENLGCRLFVRSAGLPLWLDHLPQIAPSEL